MPNQIPNPLTKTRTTLPLFFAPTPRSSSGIRNARQKIAANESTNEVSVRFCGSRSNSKIPAKPSAVFPSYFLPKACAPSQSANIRSARSAETLPPVITVNPTMIPPDRSAAAGIHGTPLRSTWYSPAPSIERWSPEILAICAIPPS